MRRAPFFLALLAVCGCRDALVDRVLVDGGEPVDAEITDVLGGDAGPGRRDAESDAETGELAPPPVEPGDDDASPRDAGAGREIWRPAPGTSWQWQLTGELDTSLDVAMYDIDLFTERAVIASLQAEGRRVVCYFDTAYEPYRPDEARLRPFRGNDVEGWPEQRWLDVRAPEVVAVMRDRIALAAEKGCDGIEADDVDVANHDTGFPLTPDDQRAFIRTLAREAHGRGLAYGLKNALEDVTALLPEVDFAINEQCMEYDECELLSPFVRAGKAVFHVEYAESRRESLESRARSVCSRANALDFDTLIKWVDLDADRHACR